MVNLRFNCSRIIGMLPIMSNIGENFEPEKTQQWQINQIIGDLRKFSEYVLVPNHKSGKDRIFLGLLVVFQLLDEG